MIQLTREEAQTLIDILLSHNAQEFRKGADAIARLQSKLAEPAHTDHPMRHHDRTCPACREEEDVETEFIKAWNADKVVRVSDGKRPSEFEKEPKPWVGLTFDDETECLAAGNAHGWKGVMKKTEEKLKEKNT